MSNKKYIEDIRRIAKTYDILKKIPNNILDKDKSPILGTRGTGVNVEPFNPCQYLYSTDDGVYDVKDIIDGVDGPKITDGTDNQCQVLNTITGMREANTTPTVKIVLKPDGLFRPLTKYYFAVQTLMYSALYNDWTDQPFFSEHSQWFYPTKEEALQAEIQAAELDFLTTGGLTISMTSGDLELTPIPQSFIDDFITGDYTDVITTSSVFYASDLSWTGDASGTGYSSILEVDSNYNYYNYLLDLTMTSVIMPLKTPPSGTVNAAQGILGMPKYYPEFQLAIETAGSNLWKPNPSENAAPVRYTNGVSIVNFEFGEDYTRTGQVHPATNGGFAIYETSGGNPIGSAYIYRYNRTLAAVVAASQLQPFLA